MPPNFAERTFVNSHKTVKFAKVSLFPRLKFFVYMLFAFWSAKLWKRGYTFMAIHVYIYPLGFVDLIPRPLGTS